MTARSAKATKAASTGRQPIRIFIPDAGPLISLAQGQALDLLLLVADDVRLVLTDVVEFEVTHRADRFPDATAIQAFLSLHADRIEVVATTIGALALADLQRKAERGEPAVLPKDVGELSITNFIISLRGSGNPGEPVLVLIEDDWFATNTYALPGNVHLLSTSAWLDGLQSAGLVDSAATVRARIQAARPHFRADWHIDVMAEKVVGGTEWRSQFRAKPKRRPG